MCVIFLFKTRFRIVIAAAQGLKNNFRATQFRWNFLLILHSDNGLCMTHAPTTLCACRGTLKNIKNHRTSADDRFRVCIYRILISMYSSVLNEHNNIGADSALTRRAQPILYIMILYCLSKYLYFFFIYVNLVGFYCQ